MKKILSILAALAFTASASSTVVACSNTSSSSKKSGQLKSVINWPNGDDVVMKLADGQVIRVKDFMKGTDDYLLNQVNGMVANKYASDYNDNTITDSSNTNLGLISANRNYSLQGSTFNGYEDEINNYSFIALATQLYQQYVNSLLTVTPLDETEITNGYDLNPVWYENDFSGSRDYSVYFKRGENYIRWTTKSETTLNINKQYLPTQDELNTADFYLVKDPKNPNDKRISDKSSITVNATDWQKLVKVNSTPLTGQQALTYRFQDYLQSQGNDSMINALVMEYEKNTLYKLQQAPTSGTPDAWEKATNKSLYVDTSSTFARDIQSWPAKSTDNITSNYKMVWRISVSQDDVDAVNAEISSLIASTDPLTTNDFAVFNSGSTIKDMFADITGAAKNTKPVDMFKKGSDPFFGMQGYQGITKDGKAVDGGTLNLNSDVTSKIAATEGFGILQNTPKSDGSLTFDLSPAKGNNRDYVIVMPLYLMDLLRDGSTPVTPNNATTDLSNIAMNNWIELNPQSGTAFKSTDDFGTDNTNGDFTKFVPDSTNKDSLPSGKNLFMKSKSGETYVFIGKATAGQSLTINDKTTKKAITISAKTTDDNDYSGYGIKGIFSNPKDSKNPDASKYNGQQVNYKIHLGIDNSNPDSYANDWTQSHPDQEVTDVNNLSNAKKTDLMNTLLAIVAKNDTTIQEETKNSIYRNYISLDDIYYKGLYDKIDKYLKEDDKTDPSD